MKSEEYFNKVKHLDWLEAILRDYNENIDLIHREQDNFVVQRIRFTARGNGMGMNINSHYSIPYGYILNGLTEVTMKLEREIQDLKDELKCVMVEL